MVCLERAGRPNQMVGSTRFWPVSDLWHWALPGRFPDGQLDLGLFGYFERVVNFNPDVADGAFELAMTE